MKYTSEIVINLPKQRVAELFDDPENLKEWQPGFLGMEHLSGEPGQPGCKTRLRYKMGKREMEMIETIKVHDMPDEFHGTFEAKGVYNLQKNYFKEEGPDQTRWVSESEFQFSSLGMKIFAWIMPGAFKKQSMKYLQYFKEFAEKQG